MDPSRSPVVADRSEIKCYIGRSAVRPFLVPQGPKNGSQTLDFTKKMDPSRSPVVADRSEIKCYIGRSAVRPFLVPRGPTIIQKRYKNSILGQNPGGCRPENPSLYQPLVAGLLISILALESLSIGILRHRGRRKIGCSNDLYVTS